MGLILNFYGVRLGWGRHTYYLLHTPQSRQRLIEALKLSYMNQINAVCGFLIIKVSIGLLLLRVFGMKKSCRWAIYSTLAFVLLTTVITVAFILAQCRPVAKYWDSGRSGHCWSSEVVLDIQYYNGGWFTNGFNFKRESLIRKTSCCSNVRLGSCNNTDRRPVEPPDEYQTEGWDRCSYGYRILVSTSY